VLTALFEEVLVLDIEVLEFKTPAVSWLVLSAFKFELVVLLLVLMVVSAFGAPLCAILEAAAARAPPVNATIKTIKDDFESHRDVRP
jgi:hypothetical protein